MNSFSVNVNGNSQNIVNDGGWDLLIGKMSSQGNILWIKNPDISLLQTQYHMALKYIMTMKFT